MSGCLLTRISSPSSQSCYLFGKEVTRKKEAVCPEGACHETAMARSRLSRSVVRFVVRSASMHTQQTPSLPQKSQSLPNPLKPKRRRATSWTRKSGDIARSDVARSGVMDRIDGSVGVLPPYEAHQSRKKIMAALILLLGQSSGQGTTSVPTVQPITIFDVYEPSLQTTYTTSPYDATIPSPLATLAPTISKHPSKSPAPTMSDHPSLTPTTRPSDTPTRMPSSVPSEVPTVVPTLDNFETSSLTLSMTLLGLDEDLHNVSAWNWRSVTSNHVESVWKSFDSEVAPIHIKNVRTSIQEQNILSSSIPGYPDSVEIVYRQSLEYRFRENRREYPEDFFFTQPFAMAGLTYTNELREVTNNTNIIFLEFGGKVAPARGERDRKLIASVVTVVAFLLLAASAYIVYVTRIREPKHHFSNKGKNLVGAVVGVDSKDNIIISESYDDEFLDNRDVEPDRRMPDSGPVMNANNNSRVYMSPMSNSSLVIGDSGNPVVDNDDTYDVEAWQSFQSESSQHSFLLEPLRRHCSSGGDYTYEDDTQSGDPNVPTVSGFGLEIRDLD